jgi:hypothetical protein
VFTILNLWVGKGGSIYALMHFTMDLMGHESLGHDLTTFGLMGFLGYRKRDGAMKY